MEKDYHAMPRHELIEELEAWEAKFDKELKAAVKDREETLEKIVDKLADAQETEKLLENIKEARTFLSLHKNVFESNLYTELKDWRKSKRAISHDIDYHKKQLENAILAAEGQ